MIIFLKQKTFVSKLALKVISYGISENATSLFIK
jgi:hypothetical protein